MSKFFKQKISTLKTSISNRFFLFAAFFIVIVGALFVRIYNIGDYHTNNDEAWHLVVASQKNLWDVIQYNFQNEVHPPLSPIIWHFMLAISDNLLWLRSSSLLAGILVIPSIYLFGSLYIGRSAGFFMAMIVAFTPIVVSLSSSLRAYSILLLAITWEAIFVFRHKEQKSKSLVGYFFCAFASIQLLHGAAFILLVFGLMLMQQAINQKNKKDFFIIAIMHLFFAFLVIGYGYVLKHHYGFTGNDDYFSPSPIYYLSNFLGVLTFFVLESDFQNWFLEGFKQTCLFVILIAPFLMIKSRKWQLLHIIFTPIVALIFADIFHFYPFSSGRVSLFLFLSTLTLCGFGAQVIVNYFYSFCAKYKLTRLVSLRDILKDKSISLSLTLGLITLRTLVLAFKIESLSKKNLSKFFSILAILLLGLITFTISKSFYENDFFRNDWPSCPEFIITKDYYKKLQQELSKKKSNSNIFITTNTDIWNLILISQNAAKIKYITKNLAEFKNQDLTVYFTSFPERENPNISKISDYKIFFNDLFNYLKSLGEFSKINSITYFDAGLTNDLLSQLFRDQLCKLPKSNIPKLSYDYSFYLQNNKPPYCRKEVLLFSLTPQFIEKEFLK